MFQLLVVVTFFHSGYSFQASTMLGSRLSSLSMSNTDEDYYLRLYEEENEESESSASSMEAVKSLYEMQRQKREWGLQMEEWKRMGIQARRDRRRVVQKEQRLTKAQEMSRGYLLQHGDVKAEELVTAFFARLLDQLHEMEQEAYGRAKQRAIQREMEIVLGNATDTYIEELEEIREMEQAQRRDFQEHVFELPNQWESKLDDEELLAILRIRGNVENAEEVQEREEIESFVRDSFAKALF